MSGSRIAAALLVALCVAGCAALLRDGGAPPRAPQPFDLSGRVVVSYDGRAFSSNLRWQHLPERDEIWLLTPLGQALAHIVGSEEGATFTGADRRQYQGASVEDLTRQALGWELPLRRLQYWVRGEIVPGEAAGSLARDAEQRLTELVQAGWGIRIAYYAPQDNGGLPRRVELTRHSNESIRLVIDTWRRDPAMP